MCNKFQLPRVNQRNQRTQADGGGITAPESTIATVCGSDAQDPPIVADRRNSPNRRHRGARILQADRVLIFQLGSDGSGKVVKEAVVPGWPVILGQSTLILAFNKGMERYRQGRISAITDLEKADIQLAMLNFYSSLQSRPTLWCQFS